MMTEFFTTFVKMMNEKKYVHDVFKPERLEIKSAAVCIVLTPTQCVYPLHAGATQDPSNLTNLSYISSV